MALVQLIMMVKINKVKEGQRLERPWQLPYTKSYDDKWEEVEDLTPNSNLEEADLDLMKSMGSEAQLPPFVPLGFIPHSYQGAQQAHQLHSNT